MNTLYLTEIYASIQGETTHVGLATTFIRLSGCNLRCVWCDTPYSFKRGAPHTEEEVLKQVETLGHQAICVTGGEPLMQKGVISLMQKLTDKGYLVSLETGGSLTIADVPEKVHVILDLKCPASGMSEKNHWENIPLLKEKDQVKFVINDRADYEWAKEITKKYELDKKAGSVLFSPVHEALEAKELAEWILEDKLHSVRLNLQLHKTIWDAATRGV